MDQRRLEYFLTVAEELNFTRAAQQLHVTQSTLSAGIKALEQDLKAELLIRSTRSVRLTEAGSAFPARGAYRDRGTRPGQDAVEPRSPRGCAAASPWASSAD
ncbi:LysR family transcriptional regulator [Streptomyces thinghirensis]|nr:LysR family transcriptional regulator [Streptomyces thinghirensis]